MASKDIPSEDREKSPRHLFVMRHGERCDFSFGRQWINWCFDSKGNYTQKDLNLPISMVQRDSHKDFSKDSPLTEIGRFQAKSTGEAFKRAGVNIRHIYVSPALRCVQTAQGVIDGLGNDSLLMDVEPSAFEWFGWYKTSMPVWMPPKQLAAAGFSVNEAHKPFHSMKELNLEENVSEYYFRCNRLAHKILEKHKDDEGDILVVAHAGSLDTFTRQLQGELPRGVEEMHNMLSNFYYCCLCCCEELGPKVWRLRAPPIPPLQNFDWKVML